MKKKKFTLNYDIKLLGVSIEVEADSMEDALAKAKGISHTDLFKKIGVNVKSKDILDSEVELMSIWK